MYLCFGIIFVILLLFFCLNYWRKRKIIRKIRCMCMEEKCRLIDELVEPMGYTYVLSQDIFTSLTSAWQKEFGYCALYDRAAPIFHMVFDSLPVYFDYCGRTWLIEFWKGQYGINTGCEIGVYYADRILDGEERRHTVFQAVDEKDMLQMSFSLSGKKHPAAELCGRHWWLTAFLMGCFSRPSDLSMCCSVKFPSDEMAEAFAEGLLHAGYSRNQIQFCCRTVTFTFHSSAPVCGICRKIQIHAVQYCNRFWCCIYQLVTRPFRLSVDKVLYLYYYLPFAFRRMFRLRRFRKHKRHPHRR